MILIVLVAYDEVVNVKTHTVKDRVIALNRTTVSCIYICTLDDGRQFVRMEYDDIGAIPLWQDSWHYLIINQLGGSGVDSASLF